MMLMRPVFSKCLCARRSKVTDLAFLRRLEERERDEVFFAGAVSLAAPAEGFDSVALSATAGGALCGTEAASGGEAGDSTEADGGVVGALTGGGVAAAFAGVGGCAFMLGAQSGTGDGGCADEATPSATEGGPSCGAGSGGGVATAFAGGGGCADDLAKSPPFGTGAGGCADDEAVAPSATPGGAHCGTEAGSDRSKAASSSTNFATVFS